MNGNLAPVNEVEWFDPLTNTYLVASGVALPRLGASVAAVEDGGVVAVAGGTDGTTLQTAVTLLSWNGSDYVANNAPGNAMLTAPGRRSAATAVVGSAMVLAGGYGDPTQVAPVSTSELIDVQAGTDVAGATVGSRGEACAVRLENGDVFITGGRSVDANNAPQSVGSTVILHFTSGGTAPLSGPTLPTPRSQHSCTLLPDGTVLVAGGVDEQGGIFTVLQDALVFQPMPND